MVYKNIKAYITYEQRGKNYKPGINSILKINNSITKFNSSKKG